MEPAHAALPDTPATPATATAGDAPLASALEDMPLAGPPAGPSVPAVRRALVAAFRGCAPCVVRCPACHARVRLR